jgi:hypothetical protein
MITYRTYFVPDDASGRAAVDFVQFVETETGARATVQSLSGGAYLVSVSFDIRRRSRILERFESLESASSDASGRRGFYLAFPRHASAWRYSESLDQFRARLAR